MRKSMKFCFWVNTTSPPIDEIDELEDKADEISKKYRPDSEEKSDSSEREKAKDSYGKSLTCKRRGIRSSSYSESESEVDETESKTESESDDEEGQRRRKKLRKRQSRRSMSSRKSRSRGIRSRRKSRRYSDSDESESEESKTEEYDVSGSFDDDQSKKKRTCSSSSRSKQSRRRRKSEIENESSFPNESSDSGVDAKSTKEAKKAEINVEVLKFKEMIEAQMKPALDNESVVGLMPLPKAEGHISYGGALRPGEGDAIAQYVQQGKRIPRRGEVGLKAEEIQKFESLGNEMSGSRHQRTNAICIRKERQVYSAEDKQALAMLSYEEKSKCEHKVMADLQRLVQRHIGQDVGPSHDPFAPKADCADA